MFRLNYFLTSQIKPELKSLFILIFLLICSVGSFGQASKDSLSYPRKIIVIKNKDIPVADSTDLSFIKVDWLITQKFVKDEKFKNEPGFTHGTVYIYLKKKYYRKLKKRLEIK